MSVNWKGDAVLAKTRRAQITAVNTTMAAAVIHAKENHGPGAHGAGRFETQTASLERSIRIVEAAKRIVNGVKGTYGSTDTIYARRIELGFEGKTADGKIVNAPAFPFMIPAAQVEHPKLARRIRENMR